MRQDDGHVGIAIDDAVEHQLHCGAGGVEGIVDQRPGDTVDRLQRWLAGMDEDQGVAPIEFGP